MQQCTHSSSGAAAAKLNSRCFTRSLLPRAVVVTAGEIGSSSGGTYGGLSGLIQKGRNGGGWGGSGIVTVETQATSGNFTSIGIASGASASSFAARNWWTMSTE